MRLGPVVLGLIALAACEPLPQQSAPLPAYTAPAPGPTVTPAVARSAFASVTRQVEPVAERICREQTRGANCDFRIFVDPDASQPANAYQSLDDDGRPVIGFTLALVNDARNQDELAFVLGHEAAHHILGHLSRQQTTAMTGALLGGIVAQLGGFDPTTAQQIGAGLGARTYSKSHELEADDLGTEIAMRAGFDPVRGAAFFSRLPDPGDQFLGTHPASTQRIDVVRRRAAQLGYR